MKSDSLKIGYTIKMDRTAKMRPSSIHYWTQPELFRQHPSEKPLHFLGDAILGLSTLELNSYLCSPLNVKSMNFDLAQNAWFVLDPHITLFEKSHTRMQAIQKDCPPLASELLTQFQNDFLETLSASETKTGFDFSLMTQLIEDIDRLEDQMGQPILFHFGLKFHDSFRLKLQQVFSLLHHLRVVVAAMYNREVQDTTLQALKVDSITDYLPKADYLVNDALLYWHFKKLTRPLVQNDAQEFAQKVLIAPMEKNFRRYLNNACSLVDHLPANFLESMNPVEMEDSLYLLKMDWLLGSDSGLLFRIREELYGLQEGYSQLFWSDTDLMENKLKGPLHISVQLRKKALQSEAA